MEKIVFVGSYDKADLILCIAKALVNMRKKVLVCDTTTLSKTKYIVPSMQGGKQYITTYQDVDIAIGFESIDQVKQANGSLDYDYILLDIDSYRGYYYYRVKPEEKHFFVTSFDLYNLRKGLQVLKKVEGELNIQKVFYTKEMDPYEDKYFMSLVRERGIKANWNKEIIYFPFETSDLNAIYINQRSERISLKGLSGAYVDSVEYLLQKIVGAKSGDTKKAIRALS